MGFLYSQLFVKPKYPSESFKGQTVIVTGSNTGLGKEAARHFARLGVSKLILAVRNTSAGENARREIEETTHCGPGVIEVWKLDLASYESVQTFATRAAKDLARIDVLLENAGIAVSKFALAEGHERTVTVNVISTFLLALLLLPKLEATARDYNTHPRLTIVSSEVHGHSKFPEWKAANSFVTLSDQKTANMGERYPTSKLLEVLVCRAIAPKIAERGTGVVLNYLNPEVGSRTLMAAAEAGPESHGKYMTDGLPNDGALSAFVRSEDGNKASKKIWNELADILEKIHPGVTNPVK